MQEWEEEYGRIPDAAVVLMHTGWGSRYPDPQKVFNTVHPEDPNTYHFPGGCVFTRPGGGGYSDGKTDRQTGRQMDGQTGSMLSDTHTHTHTHSHTHTRRAGTAGKSPREQFSIHAREYSQRDTTPQVSSAGTETDSTSLRERIQRENRHRNSYGFHTSNSVTPNYVGKRTKPLPTFFGHYS